MKKSMLLLCFMATFSLFAQDNTQEIRTLSQKRQLAECEILVTPNPSNGDIFVNAPEGSTCMLTSAKGTYIGTWRVEKGGFRLEGMSMGSYIAIIKQGDEVITRRFVVL